MNTTRCKFRCAERTERENWSSTPPTLWAYKFYAVTDDSSEENAAFWDATPAGSLEVTAVNSDLFQVGVEYYIDITEAPVTKA